MIDKNNIKYNNNSKSNGLKLPENNKVKIAKKKNIKYGNYNKSTFSKFNSSYNANNDIKLTNSTSKVRYKDKIISGININSNENRLTSSSLLFKNSIYKKSKIKKSFDLSVLLARILYKSDVQSSKGVSLDFVSKRKLVQTLKKRNNKIVKLKRSNISPINKNTIFSRSILFTNYFFSFSSDLFNYNYIHRSAFKYSLFKRRLILKFLSRRFKLKSLSKIFDSKAIIFVNSFIEIQFKNKYLLKKLQKVMRFKLLKSRSVSKSKKSFSNINFYINFYRMLANKRLSYFSYPEKNTNVKHILSNSFSLYNFLNKKFIRKRLLDKFKKLFAIGYSNLNNFRNNSSFLLKDDYIFDLLFKYFRNYYNSNSNFNLQQTKRLLNSEIFANRRTKREKKIRKVYLDSKNVSAKRIKFLEQLNFKKLHLSFNKLFVNVINKNKPIYGSNNDLKRNYIFAATRLKNLKSKEYKKTLRHSIISNELQKRYRKYLVRVIFKKLFFDLKGGFLKASVYNKKNLFKIYKWMASIRKKKNKLYTRKMIYILNRCTKRLRFVKTPFYLRYTHRYAKYRADYERNPHLKLTQFKRSDRKKRRKFRRFFSYRFYGYYNQFLKNRIPNYKKKGKFHRFSIIGSRVKKKKNSYFSHIALKNYTDLVANLKPPSSLGRIYVRFKTNNTFVSITNLKDKLIYKLSSGGNGFFGPKRATHYAKERLASAIGHKAVSLNYKIVDIYFKTTPYNKILRNFLRGLNETDLSVRFGYVFKSPSHGFIRAKKRRRL